MKRIAFYLSALALVVVVATGCSKLPQVELDAAKAAVESTKAVEANRYLPTEFNALQDSLNAANVAVETEKSRFFISRDYKPVTAQLVKIAADAEALKAKTEERKVQVREEVQTALTALTALIAEDKALLAKAPKGKEGKAALKAIQDDITVIEASVNDINTLVASGDYLTAQDKVNASTTKAEAIKEELKAAIAKASKKRK
jgi:hypothetical protein